jgi:hypothetical protein
MRSISFALALLATGAMSTAALAENTSLEGADQIQIGTGVICDTQDEASDFVRIMSEHDAGAALQEINRKASSPLACGMATVAFRTGKSLGEVHTGKGSFNILEIEVLAGAVDGSWHAVPSRRQFTAMAVKGLDI